MSTTANQTKNHADDQASKNKAFADQQLEKNKRYFDEQVSRTQEQINDQVGEAKERFNDQVNKLVGMQSHAFVPMQMFGNLAVRTMDQLYRKNVAVMGDLIEYTLKQAHVPASGDYVTEMMNARTNEAKAFGELLGHRANEYAEIANDFGSRAKDVTDDVIDGDTKSKSKSR